MVGINDERRDQPRVQGRAGIRLTAGATDCSVIDISSSGIRFLTDEPPPLMSQVDIHLEIPDMTPGRDEMVSVRCLGAVVRTTEVDDRYEVAVFITQIDDDDRYRIGEYVRRHTETAA